MSNTVNVVPKLSVVVTISLNNKGTIEANPDPFEVQPGGTITWEVNPADRETIFGIVFKNESPLQHRAYIIPPGGILTQKIAVAVASSKDFEYTIIASDPRIPPKDPIGRVIP